MSTSSSETIHRTDGSSENSQTEKSVLSPIPGQTTERIITPIQPPLDSGITDRSSVNNGFLSGSKTSDPTFSVLRAKVLEQIAHQPLLFVRTLMQMGYEPIAASRGKNIFGNEALYYPNVFHYMKYIYRQDGFIGFYRGFGCSLLSTAVCLYTSSKVDDLATTVQNRTTLEKETPNWNGCIEKSLREIRCQSWGILVSQPFYVMAVRCMGQFVGRETNYSSFNIIQNFREIYEKDGIGGFFVGLMPRWLLEVSTIALTNLIVYLLKSQLSSQKELSSLFEFTAKMIAESLNYPLNVTNTVIIINRSGLQAGKLPLTPVSAHWQDAYKYLCETKQLKRGSKLFSRTAIGLTGIPARNP